MTKLYLKLYLTALFSVLVTSSAWAVYCPVGGAIYHRSGEEQIAIARCTEYIKQAKATGQKLPNERAWRAAKAWNNIPNSQPYPLSWNSSEKPDKPSATTVATREVVRPADKGAAATATPKPIREAAPPPAAKKPPAAETPKLATVQPVPPVTEPLVTQPAVTQPAVTAASRIIEEKNAPGGPIPAAEASSKSPEPNRLEPNREAVQKLAEATAGPVAIAPQLARERRVALVVGNSKYASQGSLDNPRNDAEAVATTLREIGFQSVTTLHNLGRDKMVEALQNFASEADDADWAVVYYAGHGMEVGGSNFLIPIDAKLRVDRDVQFEAVALDHVLNSVESAKKLRLVILDACRDNPFLPQMRRTLVSRAIGRGLAPIETDRSMLVFFAAKHGQISLDRIDGKNSPFTTSLVHWMKMPGLEINKVLRHVRDDVLKVTQRSQEPYQYGSLSSDDFFFRPVEAQAVRN